jgi:four helix bundle protein
MKDETDSGGGAMTGSVRPRAGQRAPVDLRVRTKELALRVIRLCSSLPDRGAGGVIANQVLRSGTSVGAHYREAYRVKSGPDFVNKMQGALQELDETAYWLELLEGSQLVTAERLKDLRTETDELIAIFVSIVKKVKAQ